MRRPAIIISAAFGAGIFTAYQIQAEPLIWVMLLTFSAAFFVFCKLRDFGTENRILMFLFLLLFAAGGFRLEAEDLTFQDYEKDFGSRFCDTGVIIKAEEKDDRYDFIFKSNGKKYLVRYYGKINDESCSTYDYAGCIAEINGEIQQPQGKRNPGCFDYSLYLKSCGTGAIIDADSVEIYGKGSGYVLTESAAEGTGSQIGRKNGENPIPLLQITAGVKSRFEGRLSGFADEQTKDLMMAMLFGEKAGLDERIYEEFQKNGTAHVLAVSGLHVGILYGFFAFWWRGKKGMAFHMATLVILLMYIMLADFSPSVMRAAAMIAIHAAAGILRRRYDLMSAAGVTFTTILAVQPFQLFHTGFQLSFMAVASLGVILPYVKSFYKGIFLTSAAIQLGMAPYTAFLFNYLAAGTVIVNVPVVIMAGILLPAGFCMLIMSLVPGNAVDTMLEVISLFTETGCHLMVRINEIFYMDGMASFDVVSPPVWLLVIYYGIVFFMLSETGQLLRLRAEREKLAAAVAVVLLVAFSVNVLCCDGFRKADIIFVDVGQGDCIHVKTPDGANYLIDGGGSTDYDVGMNTLKPYLLKNGVEHVDAAFVTHLHEDHYGGIKSLAEDGMIDSIGVYEGNRVIEKQIKEQINADENETAIFYLHDGQKITLSEDVYLEVLAPAAKTDEEYMKMQENQEDENESSLILKLTYMDISVLITGDIDVDGEKALMASCGQRLDSTIVKVPHHGSRYSSSAEFVEAVNPEYAVFQVGKNNYGHPTEEALNRYREAGVKILRNDRNGAIGFDIGKDRNMKVMKMVD